jgi:ribosome biogenesis GTPase A
MKNGRAEAGHDSMDITNDRLGEFSIRKSHLLRCASELRDIADRLNAGTSARLVSELMRNLQEERFNIVVLGGFKRGKSTLINAMVGARILPMGVVPLTSVITKIVYGSKPTAEVHFTDGRKLSVDVKDIDQYVTERLNPNNVKNVVEVEVHVNSNLLEQGVVIVDTPGIGSTFTRNTLVTYDFLPKVDAALFVFGVEPPISQAELDFLRDVRSYTDRLFLVLNKIDMMTEKDRIEVLEFSNSVLRESLAGIEPEIFSLSAKTALEARENADQDKLRASGYLELDTKLREFLARGKADALIGIATRRLTKIASDLITAVEIEHKIVSEPVAEIDKKMQWLQQEIQVAKRKLDEFSVLLKDKVARMIESYTEELEEVRRRATPKLIRGLDECIQKIPERCSKKEYLELLQKYITEAVEKTFEPFVKTLPARISQGLTSAIDDVLSGADRYSKEFEAKVAEMFGIEPRLAEALPMTLERSTFYFDEIRILRCESIIPPELPMLLPNRLYRKTIANKARDILLSELEKHAGRIRYDFDYRLTEIARSANAELRNRMLSMIESLESAYLTGLKSRDDASRIRDARLAFLHEIDGRLRTLLGNAKF